MKLKEVETGEIINIENTPSYPKLKIDGGYVDMRDDIVNRSGNCDEREVSKMSYEDLAKQFGEEDLQEWIDEKKEKYLPLTDK